MGWMLEAGSVLFVLMCGAGAAWGAWDEWGSAHWAVRGLLTAAGFALGLMIGTIKMSFASALLVAYSERRSARAAGLRPTAPPSRLLGPPR